MSIQNMYSVFDLQAQSFGFPFTAKTDGAAIRIFANETNRSDDSNLLHNHPADFVLFAVGTFNSESGEVVAFQPAPTRLKSGTEVQTIPS